MTDRHSGYVVILDRDIREDDAETVMTALRMVRGVQSVEPVVAEVSAGLIADSRARTEMRGRLLDFLNTF